MTGLRSALHCTVASVALLAFGALPVTAAAAPKIAKSAKSATKTHKKVVKVAPVEAAPTDATPEQIAAAQKVYYGNYGCEFKQAIDIEKNAKYPAYVDVTSGKSRWMMKPVLSSTGAIRLEDVKGETLMVQISSKSMLLNVKTAQRIVDDCVCEEQRELIKAANDAKANGTAAAEAPPLLQAPAVAANPPSAAEAAQPVAAATTQAR